MDKLIAGTAIPITIVLSVPKDAEAQPYITIPKYDRDRRELPIHKHHRFYSAIPPSDEYGPLNSLDVSVYSEKYLLDQKYFYGDVSLDLYPKDFEIFGQKISLCGLVDIPLIRHDMRDMMPKLSLGPKLERHQKEGKLYWRPRIEFYGYKPHRLANYMTLIFGKEDEFFMDMNNAICRKLVMEDRVDEELFGFQRLTDEIGFDIYTDIGWRINNDNYAGIGFNIVNSELSEVFLKFNNRLNKILKGPSENGGNLYVGFSINDDLNFNMNFGASMTLGRSKRYIEKQSMKKYHDKTTGIPDESIKNDVIRERDHNNEYTVTDSYNGSQDYLNNRAINDYKEAVGNQNPRRQQRKFGDGRSNRGSKK